MAILATIGVDVRSQVHGVAAVDPQGRVLDEHSVRTGVLKLSVRNTSAGGRRRSQG